MLTHPYVALALAIVVSFSLGWIRGMRIGYKVGWNHCLEK